MKDSRDEGAMQHILAEQKQALLHQAVPDLAQRRRLLQGCIDLLVENYGALCRAVSEDNGHRSEHLTLGEIQGALPRPRWLQELQPCKSCFPTGFYQPAEVDWGGAAAGRQIQEFHREAVEEVRLMKRVDFPQPNCASDDTDSEQSTVVEGSKTNGI